MPRKNRKRCPCGKIVFPTKDEAYFQIGVLAYRGDRRAHLIQIYRCDCLVLKGKKAGWHIGHSHKKYDFLKEKKHELENRQGV